MKDNRDEKVLFALMATFILGLGIACSGGPDEDPEVAEKEAAQPVSDDPEAVGDQTGEGE